MNWGRGTVSIGAVRAKGRPRPHAAEKAESADEMTFRHPDKGHDQAESADE
jgi:hypothetical protein